MDRTEITSKAQKLKTVKGLHNLINALVLDELASHGAGDKFRPIKIQVLNYYRNPNHAGRYVEFKIPKKSGGERTIDAPRSHVFKMILRAVNVLLQSLYTPSEYAMGFTAGRSVATNAQQHVGQHYVFNIDLKDFFPSIEQARLWGRLQVPPFKFTKEVASAIAGLCCIKTEDGRFVLPQGSPASPVITNMICDRLDHRLGGLARRFGLRYTRYADDITFSSPHNVYQEGSDFRVELERIITDQNFRMNPKKTRLARPFQRQEVTGVTVNKRTNVTQAYVRDLRAILHVWKKYGYLAALDSFQRYDADKQQGKSEQKKSRHRGTKMERVIEGKLMYLKMVKGSDDAVFKHLMDEFQQLTGRAHDMSNANGKGILYIDTIPLPKFEKSLGVEIQFVRKDGHLFGTFTDKDGKNHDISVANFLKPSLTKMLEGEETGGKNVAEREKIAVSTCRMETGGLFLLIHKISKQAQIREQAVDLNVPEDPVDVDALNDELDALLKEP